MKQSKRFQLAKSILKSEIGLLTCQFMGLMNNDMYSESDWDGFKSRTFTFNDNKFQLQMKHTEGEGEVSLSLIKVGDTRKAGDVVVTSKYKKNTVHFPINGYMDRYLISKELANLADIPEYIHIPDDKDNAGRHTFLERFSRIVNVEEYVPYVAEELEKHLPRLIRDVLPDGVWRNELPTFQIAFYKGNKLYYYDLLTGYAVDTLMRRDKINQFASLKDFSQWLAVKLTDFSNSIFYQEVKDYQGEMELRVCFNGNMEVLYVRTV